MLKSNPIWEDIRRQMSQPNEMITKLIIVNVAIWAFVNLIKFSLALFTPDTLLYATYYYDYFFKWIALPSNPSSLLYRPWTLVTYMFVHEGFFHIVFNMLWLYWMGRILQDLVGFKKVLPIYILGGLAGGLLYILSYNLFPGLQGYSTSAQLIGASAGVLAIVFAAATLSPDYTIHLIFFGPVKIKYLALVSLVLDIMSIGNLNNVGGHIAHIGGAFLGFIFIKQLQQGNDWSIFPNRIFEWFANAFKSNPQPKVAHKRSKKSSNEKPSTDAQAKVDKILDKIAESGYESLSADEKAFLFKYSKG